jgi:ubiquinone/menaquinone biosynthesis C-methylase UbiE
MTTTTGLLGDTPQRTYGQKLDLFNRFAEPELRQFIQGLSIAPSHTVLDVGCGTGFATNLWATQLPEGRAIGLDLAEKHIQFAKQQDVKQRCVWVQGSLTHLPFPKEEFDWIWCSNTINHLREPIAGIQAIATTLKPNGRFVLAQSAFLPDMFFAWDARLERLVTEACRHYYRDKYGLQEEDTTHVRNLVGMMTQAGLTQITPHTLLIERIAPLTALEIAYFLNIVFRGYWGEKIRPYLSPTDWQQLEALTDPDSPDFCLNRPDFHHLQTYTIVMGTKS